MAKAPQIVDPYPSGYPRYAKITASEIITSTASVLILPENLKRVGLYLYNASGQSVYISFAEVGNSANTLCLQMATYTQWVMPPPVYRGAICGIRNGAGTGRVIATELMEYK